MDDADRNREEWRAIPGYEGYYEASSLGRVRSFHRSKVRILVQPLNTAKRPQACLSVKGAKVTRPTHILVLQAFVGPRPDGGEALERRQDGQQNR